jgi:hypothetical protein
MSMTVINKLLLVVGLIGLPICIWAERRSHAAPYLLGIGLFGYLLISSVIFEIRAAIQK